MKVQKQREDNFLNSLEKSELSMKTALDASTNSIKSKIENWGGRIQSRIEDDYKETESKLEDWISLRAKADKAKTWILILMTILAISLIVLIGANWWLGKSIQDKQQELAEIQQNIEQTPLQAKALAKLEITQESDKSILITAKNTKRAKAFSETKSLALQ